MKKYLLVCLLSVLSLAGTAATPLLDMSKASIVSKSDADGLGYSYFKFLYPSVGLDGREVILSGLVVYPNKTSASTGKRILPRNEMIGCHVTITKNQKCPSNFSTVTLTINDVLCYSYYASGSNDTTDVAYNNLLVMPDYLGYGVTVDSVHPYLDEQLTARHVVDAALYGKALWETLTYEEDGKTKNYQMASDGWQSIVCGYSQGGATAMATHRYIEEHSYCDDMHFRGSICGDGPYSEQITMNKYIRENKVEVPAVALLVVNGLIVSDSIMRKHTLDEYFTPEFLNTGIEKWIKEKKISTNDIKDSLKRMGFTSKTTLAQLFRSDIVSAMNGETTNEAYSDLIQAMAKNDLISGWTPRHRICLFHSSDDEVVSLENCTDFMDINYKGRDGLVKSMIGSYGDHVYTGMSFMLSSVSHLAEMMKWIFGDTATWASVGDDYMPTSVQSVDVSRNTNSQQHNIYDLNGRRMNESGLSKGIYIRDGHKFVMQ